MLREGLMQYWWLLYRHSKILGQRTDIYRNVEDAYTARQGDLFLKPDSIHLDVGSGSSLVPTFFSGMAPPRMPPRWILSICSARRNIRPR